MRRPAAAQLLKIDNGPLTVAWIAVVNRISLEEVPTLSLRIVKYRRIASVCGNNQCIVRCDFV